MFDLSENIYNRGLARDERTARERLRGTLASGAAAERFARMVAGLGGPADLLERPDHYLPPAPVVLDVPAQRDGWVGAIDTRALGMVVVTLGGGRTDPGQDIDPRVGLDRLLRRGQSVREGEPLARVHAADEASAREAIALVQSAFDLMEVAPPPAGEVVIERMDAPARKV